ncbi:unnamed protein product [Cyprideis torosa]|uniref:Angiotensin-converting enzyme n=1 Tax=Cyprideis torosa TaxID=163714 RepID=A0A7R8W500_9CRUS|nr:unnamed protein product [Cyprideis torosa]CAG0882352.1 unnamed protein product [Cyprideis torosa]
MWLWCRWWLLVVVSVSGAPASNSLNTDVAVIEKVNCTPDKDDETAIQRIRAHFLADSCPQGKEASCTWTGDTTASCYLKYYSNSSKTIFKAAALANWDYSTNITEANLKKKKEATKMAAAWEKEEWTTTISKYRAPPRLNEVLRRQLWSIEVIGGAALSDEKFNRLQDVTTELSKIYGTGKVCPYTKQDCDLATEGMRLEGAVDERTIKDELEEKTDYDELAYYWKAWRDATGAKMRDLYLENLQLLKEIAVANGMNDMGQLWRRSYEDDEFLNGIENAWQTLKPFYQELHAYARHKLLKVYPNHPDFQNGGLIPAHLLGNMWAQSWAKKFKLLKFSDADAVDLDAALKKKYSSVNEFFVEADAFFQDIGLDPLPQEFYERSMVVKPVDREVQCHASAWDIDPPDVRLQNEGVAHNEEDLEDATRETGTFAATTAEHSESKSTRRATRVEVSTFDLHRDGAVDEFSVKMCTKFKFQDFNVVHHELGHIQYYLLYAHQSNFFRKGANPGFHEAVGDLMSLSVNTPTHLKTLGLYETPENFNQTANDVNFLLEKALEKIVFMPFAYIMDKYREEYQGVKAPVERSELDFDAGSKFHTASNVPYIRYFVAAVLQYSFHKELCIIGGHYDENDPNSKPLHLCDISAGDNTAAVGRMLRNVLSLGSSKPPQDVLEIITGKRVMSTDAMLEYFKPLRLKIKRYLEENNVPVGWEDYL